MTAPLFIGIDFGTSNSKMAWYNPKTKQAEMIRNAEGEEQTPSVVYFGKGETLVGRSAEEMLEYEKERERVIVSIKRELMTTKVIALPENQTIKPIEVAAEIISKLKSNAEKLLFRQEISHVVITCPASFGPLERDIIRDASRLAGFSHIALLEEPVAAALAYTQMGLKVGKYMLVYDLGGGTFDLAVLGHDEDGTFHLALEPLGIKHCGGDDFDEALYNYCDQIAKQKLHRAISLTGKRDIHFLRECRNRKENLSNHERRTFSSLLDPGDVIFRHELLRATFEGLIQGYVDLTINKVKILLDQAKTRGQIVDTVLLIGGSSRVPLVKRQLEKSLSLNPQLWEHQDVAVALGAAYYAHTLWSEAASAKSVSLNDINSYSSQDKVKISDKTEAGVQVRAESTFDFVIRHTINENPNLVGSLAFSPDGLFLVSGSNGKKVKVWSIQTGKWVRSLIGNSGIVRSIAISPDGKLVASGCADNIIKLWNIQTGELLRILTGHNKWVFSVIFSPDGQTLISGSKDGTINIWASQTGKILRTLTGHLDAVRAVALSKDGKLLVSGSDDKMLRLWNPSSGKCLRTITGHSEAVRCVAIGPDGRLLVSGSDDKTIKLWSPHTGALLQTLKGNSAPVSSIAISPDGQNLASASADQTLKLWNLQTLQLLSTLPGHFVGSPIVAFSQDGQSLASASGDSSIRIWKRATP